MKLSVTRALAFALVLWVFPSGCREGGNFDYWDSGFDDGGPDIPLDTADPVDVGPDIELPAPGVRAVQLAAGYSHVCALGDDSSVYCWGENWLGQSAAGTLWRQLAPSRVNGLPPIASIHSSSGHTCALDRDGGVWCWGNNSTDQLGVPEGEVPECGLRSCSRAPVRVDVPPATALFVSDSGTCARGADGIQCWGEDRVFLQVPTDELTNAQDIDFGGRHGCALTDGDVRCFGDANLGRLGARSDGVIEVPNVVDLEVGSEHTCVLDASGRVLCWGHARASVLGSPEGGLVECSVGEYSSFCGLTPTSPRSLPPSRALSVGNLRSCVITTAGTVLCWGTWSGRGIDTFRCDRETCHGAPASVRGVDDAVAIATGGSVTCVIDGDGAVHCWGFGERGQLGNGRVNEGLYPEPIRVMGFGEAR